MKWYIYKSYQQINGATRCYRIFQQIVQASKQITWKQRYINDKLNYITYTVIYVHLTRCTWNCLRYVHNMVLNVINIVKHLQLQFLIFFHNGFRSIYKYKPFIYIYQIFYIYIPNIKLYVYSICMYKQFHTSF